MLLPGMKIIIAVVAVAKIRTVALIIRRSLQIDGWPMRKSGK